jgi:hypothetical protein
MLMQLCLSDIAKNIELLPPITLRELLTRMKSLSPKLILTFDAISEIRFN